VDKLEDQAVGPPGYLLIRLITVFDPALAGSFFALRKCDSQTDPLPTTVSQAGAHILALATRREPDEIGLTCVQLFPRFGKDQR